MKSSKLELKRQLHAIGIKVIKGNYVRKKDIVAAIRKIHGGDSNKLRFLELSPKAQKKAVQDYLKGWEETHGKGDITYKEAFDACEDTNDECFYTKDGDM